ncbi:MFS transporter [Zhengella mangrovi]|uniref:MFS transporter n=1 Tax=Zhengella mangrovi TaxID=1982044 RepID=A0A2G1QK64_9HYPH|nr:MFS transporter [Zhengella mangrovi]PHP65923.1 MFS transporter [Zhengella mangrovi]
MKRGSKDLYYGWVVVAIAFVTMAVAVNARTGYSLLLPQISREFGWATATTSGPFSLGFLASTAFVPVLGILMDRYGPRIAIPFGALLVAAGYAGAVVIQSPVGLYMALGLLAVMGSMAMSYIGHSMFLPNWFVRRRGLAIGIAFSGVGIGAITLLPLLQWTIDTHGWRTACLGIAVLTLAVVLPLNFLFQRTRPQDMDLLPDGAGEPVAASRGPAPGEGDARTGPAIEWTLALALKSGRFWWISGAYFCGLFVWYSIQVHQTNFLLREGVDSVTAASALGLVALFGVVGQIALGALSDKVGREMAWTLALGGFAAAAALLATVDFGHDPRMIFVMAAVQGLLGYGAAAIYGAIPAEVFSGPQFARIFSILSLFGNFGAATGVLALGVIDDLYGGYRPGWWLCVLASACSIASMWMAAPGRARAAGQPSR